MNGIENYKIQPVPKKIVPPVTSEEITQEYIAHEDQAYGQVDLADHQRVRLAKDRIFDQQDKKTEEGCETYEKVVLMFPG
jgi:hypothetical protein